MFTDLSEICMSATPVHDKTPIWFWEIYLIFTVTAETLLDGFSCLIYDAFPPRVILLFYGCDN